jgi:hypothetical protein
MDRGSMGRGSMGRGGMDHGSMDTGEGGSRARGMMGRAMMGGTMSHDGGHVRGTAGSGRDAAFAGDMDLVHGLLANHRVITRTVEHLPDGIRTLTTSDDPEVARLLVAHVASMERRLDEGEVFNLFSHTIPTIFENYDRIRTRIEYDSRGVGVVQTSDDPALVAALQAHAAEVTELVDEGMAAMMRGMMSAGGAASAGGTPDDGPSAAAGHRGMMGGGGMARMREGGGMGSMRGASGPEGLRGHRAR